MLPIGILLDNEDGIYSDAAMVIHLSSWINGAELLQILGYKSGIDAILQFDDESWSITLDELITNLQSKCPAGYYLGWIENHPGVLAVQKIEEN